jgi:hypothetical protein
MADHTDNVLGAAIRALDEVIRPAIEPEHPLANEQAKIVSQYLKQIRSRLDYSYDRDWFDVEFHAGLAREVLADARELSTAVSAELELCLQAAEQLLASRGPRVPALRAASAGLATALTALVRTAGDVDGPSSSRIEALVLERSGAYLDAQRAWFLPQGWETNPGEVPAIETVYQRNDTVPTAGGLS